MATTGFDALATYVHLRDGERMTTRHERLARIVLSVMGGKGTETRPVGEDRP